MITLWLASHLHVWLSSHLHVWSQTTININMTLTRLPVEDYSRNELYIYHTCKWLANHKVIIHVSD
jgi:hypothetical protein